MIVTIDGPSGSGKSTTARLLASRLGFEHLDTGAMFRALALFLMREDVRADDQSAFNRAIRSFDLGIQPEHPEGQAGSNSQVFVNGEEVTELLRTPEVTSVASQIAVFPWVRSFLADQQRAIARTRHIVTEGRDQGTAVFPDADWKFFLTASPEVRAQRRYLEQRQLGANVGLEDVRRAQEERDRRDSSRAIAPLTPAADAMIIDTTQLTVEEVLDQMEEVVRG